MTTKYNIIGLGIVGTALLASLKSKIEYKAFDETLKLFNETSDIYTHYDTVTFVCVNTPPKQSGEIDTFILRKVLDDLIKQQYEGIVVIKSTVLYSEIEEYVNKLNIVINPEFLNAKTSIEDFRNTRYNVLGGNVIHTKKISYDLLNDFEYDFRNEGMEFDFVTHKEAIDFKYARNIKLAMNVLYWEMVYEIMESNKVSKMMKKLPPPENDIICKDGYHGYGQSYDKNLNNFSACLDKDLTAKLNESKHPLLKACDIYNKTLINIS